MAKRRKRKKRHLDPHGIQKRIERMADPERTVEFEVTDPLTRTQEDSDRLRRAAIDYGEEAHAKFRVAFPELQRLARQQPPLFTLSTLATFLLVGMGEFGFDPELHSEERIDQAEVEIAQGLLLIEPYEVEHALEQTVASVMGFHKGVAEAMKLRREARWRRIPAERDTQETARRAVLAAIQADTDTIRNWGFLHQVERITLGIFGQFGDAFHGEFGCSAESLWQMLRNAIQLIEDRLNQHFRTLQLSLMGNTVEEVVAAYCESFAIPDPEQDRLLHLLREARANVDQARNAIIHVSHDHLAAIYSISLNEFVDLCPADIESDRLARVLDEWSGVLGEESIEDPEHVFYDNPVWTKPFVKIDSEEYLWFIPGLLNSFGLNMFEALLQSNEQLINAYHRSRALWLEDELEDVLMSAFPDATVVRNGKWKPSEEGPIYETDLILKIGSALLVVEAKSANVHPSARRGAPKRFERTIRDLIVDPSRQSQRLLEHAVGVDGGRFELTLPDGTVTVLDVTDVLDFARLNVTLEPLGFAGGRWPELREAGFINTEEFPAPTICISDLYTITDTLDTQLTCLHYLVRRCDFESEAIYHGDEIDLLAFYLDTAFDVPTSGDQAPILFLSPMSKNLDPYFLWLTRPDLVHHVPKPVMRQTKWWRDVLARIEGVKTGHWTRAGLTLLDLGFDNQRAFRSEYKKCRSQVRRPDSEDEYWGATTYVSNESNRRTMIAGLLHKSLGLENREKVISHVANMSFEKEAVDSIFVIGEDVTDNLDAPYEFSALIPRPDAKPRVH